MGNTSQCYTGLVNNSTNSIYMVASVQSYEHGVNKYTKNQNAKVTAAGIRTINKNGLSAALKSASEKGLINLV